MTAEPFRDLVLWAKEHRTYAEMQEDSLGARSASWFNNVARGRTTSPPPPETLDNLAYLLEVSTEQVAEAVAEQWYGVRLDGVTDRVRQMAPLINGLNERDVAAVSKVLQRLGELSRREFIDSMKEYDDVTDDEKVS